MKTTINWEKLDDAVADSAAENYMATSAISHLQIHIQV